MRLPSKQRGMGWFGLMIMFVAIGFTMLVGLKCWPLLLNEMKVARAVKTVAQDSSVANSEGPDTVRKALQRFWDVDDIDFVQTSEVKIKNTITGRVLAYDYWAQTNLLANVYVSFHFTKEEPFPKPGF